MTETREHTRVVAPVLQAKKNTHSGGLLLIGALFGLAALSLIPQDKQDESHWFDSLMDEINEAFCFGEQDKWISVIDDNQSGATVIWKKDDVSHHGTWHDVLAVWRYDKNLKKAIHCGDVLLCSHNGYFGEYEIRFIKHGETGTGFNWWLWKTDKNTGEYSTDGLCAKCLPEIDERIDEEAWQSILEWYLGGYA